MNILIVFIVILVICVIGYFYNKSKKRSLTRNVQESIGTFDSKAISATENYHSIFMPDKTDTLQYNRIIELNQNEGRIENKGILDMVVQNYTNILDDGDGDELDWFEIHQIENFIDRHQDMLDADRILIENINEIPRKKNIKTIQDIKESSDTKIEAVNQYKETSKTQTSDPQNVHDSAVNVQLALGYDLLKKCSGSSANKDYIKSEIENKIRQLPPLKQKKVNNALAAVMSNKINNSVIDDTESNLLYNVWNRSLGQENKNLIQESILDALEDMSTTENSVVCSNGRCTRLYESLVLLDSNETISKGLTTTEQIKNDMLDKTNEILQDNIKEYLKSDNKSLKTVAQSYNDPSIETDPIVEKSFKDMVVEKVTNFLDQEYKNKLSNRDYTNIKELCTLGVEI